MSEINLDDDDDDDSRKALGLDEQPAACLQSRDLFSCKAASVFLCFFLYGLGLGLGLFATQ